MGAQAFVSHLCRILEDELQVDEDTSLEVAGKARGVVGNLSNNAPFEDPLGEYLLNHMGDAEWIGDRMKMLNGKDIRGRWNQLVVMYEVDDFVGEIEPRIEGVEPYPLFKGERVSQKIREAYPESFRDEGETE